MTSLPPPHCLTGRGAVPCPHADGRAYEGSTERSKAEVESGKHIRSVGTAGET